MIKLIYNFLLALGTGFFVSYDIIILSTTDLD